MIHLKLEIKNSKCEKYFNTEIKPKNFKNNK